MSWPLACFAIVGGVLLVGWLAYERARPSARTVALVATLSALAALGRDAFAAFPEVKPITAMTFVVGYSLGPLPGFVVGAVGMLVSNMMLGQGPYTPWQMAAWGTVGLLGGLAGWATRRRLPRIPLALGCAFAALIAMAVMDIYEWTVSAAHTPAALLGYAGTALPFDAVDVGSTLIFGLLFGPELARLLARARERTSVQWARAGTIAPALLLCLILTLASPASPARASPSLPASLARGAPSPNTSRARASPSPTASQAVASPSPLAKRAAAVAREDEARGVAYLAAAQKSDGGLGAQRGAPSSALFTGWSAIGVAATGMSPLQLRTHGHSLLSALRATLHTHEPGGAIARTGAIERAILALHACGVPAGSAAGRALRAALAQAQRAGGSIGGEVVLTAFGIIALRAAGEPVGGERVGAAKSWLERQQNEDGGFSFGERGDQSDVDDTAAAVEALVAAGAGDPNGLSRAVAYIRGAENPDGGFPQEPGEQSNAQSTAWVVQGLVAAHEPVGLEGAAYARSPVGYLERLVAPAGSVRYAMGQTQTPVWVTAEVLAAFAAAPLPIRYPGAAAARAGSADRSDPSAPAAEMELESGAAFDSVAAVSRILAAVALGAG